MLTQRQKKLWNEMTEGEAIDFILSNNKVKNVTDVMLPKAVARNL